MWMKSAATREARTQALLQTADAEVARAEVHHARRLPDFSLDPVVLAIIAVADHSHRSANHGGWGWALTVETVEMAVGFINGDPALRVAVTGTSAAAQITTASFTPPASSIIFAIASTGNSSGSGVQSGAISDSLTGTWTSVIAANTNGQGTVQIFRRDVGGSPAVMTVTSGHPAVPTARDAAGRVYVITGAGATSAMTAVGATASALTATGTAILDYAGGDRIHCCSWA